MVLCWMWLINIVFLQLPAKEGFPVIRVICHEVSFLSRVMQVTEARHKVSFLALQDRQKHFWQNKGNEWKAPRKS